MAVLLALSVPGARGDELRKVVIPPDAIKSEIGRCFIAVMDFGEEGDNDPANHSGLLLFEDGHLLGPRSSPHAAIRSEGGGRFSHWQRTALYFSTSDGSDPRTNDRTYEVASTNPHSLLPGLPPLPTTPRERVETITASRHEYTVPMGGTLDMENTRTMSTANCRIGFQPNLELVIANTGANAVVNPRLVINDRGNWYTIGDMLAEWTRGARNDQEKAMLLWENMRRNTYHNLPLFESDEQHDPVSLYNIFGFSLCDDAASAACTLFGAAGLAGSKCRALDGHVQCEAMVGGHFQFLDVDMDCFYLDRENERPVGGDELARDHDLVRREMNYGPVVGSFRNSGEIAALFGPDDLRFPADHRGRAMDYTLRPGERAVFHWTAIGKYPAQDVAHAVRPPYFGNSQIIFEPRLTPAALVVDATGHAGWQSDPEPGVLRSDSAGAYVTYAVDVPWLVCGGQLELSVGSGPRPTRWTAEVSTGSGHWTTVWEQNGPGTAQAVIPLDETLDTRNDPPKRHYLVRLTASEPGARLAGVKLTTDIMTAPLSLPRLRLGDNTAVYTDATTGPRSVTITHRWCETDAVVPLSPPSELLSPLPGESVRADRVRYAWAPVPGARRYRLQVSLRPDFAWPYRTSLDVAIPTPEWTVPFEGIYSPDTTYYWRVRCFGERGVWGPWGPTLTFTWDGPRVPVALATETKDGHITLRWQPNPRGPRPVAYEVYGSEARGFPIARDAHAEFGRGVVPANLLGRTEATSMAVLAPGFSAAGSAAFYRVVAIDANGTRSGASDYVELPHPYIFTRPETAGTAGKPYAYQLRSLASLGDLQMKQMPEGSYANAFFDADEPRFALTRGPDWLRIDPATGMVSGTPPAPGRYPVSAEVTTRSGDTARQSWTVSVDSAPAD